MTVGSFSADGRHLLGHRIDCQRLELVSILGYGAYGVVYRAVDVSSGYRSSRSRQYAVKCLNTSGLDARQRQFQRRELALHQLASEHPNVVAMHRIVEEGDLIYVIMDYCEDGDLFGMITERQRYIGDDQLIKRVFLQILDAVQYCHSLGIYHRDLKPENILCTNGGQDVYVADFGLATSERVSRDFGCGSTFYMSPECQGGIFDRLNSYSTQTNDVWSLGVILVNLTCGRNPWRQACPSDETFRAFLQNPNFLRSILPISKNLNYILRRIFEVDPRLRLTLKQLRVLVENIDTFNMTEAELRYAHSAAQAAAASVARPRKAPVQQLPPSPSTRSPARVRRPYISPSTRSTLRHHQARQAYTNTPLDWNPRRRFCKATTEVDRLLPIATRYPRHPRLPRPMSRSSQFQKWPSTWTRARAPTASRTMRPMICAFCALCLSWRPVRDTPTPLCYKHRFLLRQPSTQNPGRRLINLRHSIVPFQAFIFGITHRNSFLTTKRPRDIGNLRSTLCNTAQYFV